MCIYFNVISNEDSSVWTVLASVEIAHASRAKSKKMSNEGITRF